MKPASQELINNILPIVVLEGEAELIYVTCECGARILLVPDIEEMARSIVVHARRHVRNEVNPKKAEIERCRIEEMLTEKVLSTASANEEEFIAV